MVSMLLLLQVFPALIYFSIFLRKSKPQCYHSIAITPSAFSLLLAPIAHRTARTRTHPVAHFIVSWKIIFILAHIILSLFWETVAVVLGKAEIINLICVQCLVTRKADFLSQYSLQGCVAKSKSYFFIFTQLLTKNCSLLNLK